MGSVTLIAVFPVFVMVRFCTAMLPTETLPKLRLVESGARVPGAGACVFAVVNPAHPDRPRIDKIMARTTPQTNDPYRAGYLFLASEHTHPQLSIRTNFLRA